MKNQVPIAALLALLGTPTTHLYAQKPTATQDGASVETGTVEVAVLPGWGISVGVDVAGLDRGPDGEWDSLYVLEAFGKIPPELPLRIQTGRILFHGDGLEVLDDQGRPVALLAVQGSQAAVRFELDPKSSVERPAFAHLGFGLSHFRVALPGPLVAAAAALLGDPFLRLNCDAGGAGATSCSVDDGHSSCSVSCAAGHFACCNNGGVFTAPTCRCEVNGAGGSGGGGGGSGGDDDECTTGGFCPAACMRCERPLF